MRERGREKREEEAVGATFKRLVGGDDQDGNVGLGHSLDRRLEVVIRPRDVRDAIVVSDLKRKCEGIHLTRNERGMGIVWIYLLKIHVGSA